jgi:hypothetical protein
MSDQPTRRLREKVQLSAEPGLDALTGWLENWRNVDADGRPLEDKDPLGGIPPMTFRGADDARWKRRFPGRRPPGRHADDHVHPAAPGGPSSVRAVVGLQGRAVEHQEDRAESPSIAHRPSPGLELTTRTIADRADDGDPEIASGILSRGAAPDHSEPP